MAVAETGSIAMAAEQLNATPPTVSAGIRNLEDVLSVEIFVRQHARGVTLTSAGQEMLEGATELLAKSELFEAAAQDFSSDATGTVTIGCYPTLAPVFMPSLIAKVRADYPNIEIVFIEETETRLLPYLESGEIDLALCYDNCLPNHVKRTVLHKTKPYCLLPAQHPLTECQELTLESLAEEPMILMDTPPGRKLFLGLFTEKGLQPNVVYRTQSFEVLRGLVAHGVGYSILVTRTNSEFTYDRMSVVQRPIAEVPSDTEICLVRMPTAHLPKVNQIIMEQCRNISIETYG